MSNVTTNQIAAFFDLDGTLFNGYVWRALQRYHEAHRFKLPTLYGYLLTHIALWPLKNAGMTSEEFFYQAWGANMAWLVKNVRVERAQVIWKWVTEHEILPNLRPEMRAALEHHRAEGHRVVLLSGTFQPLLEVIAACVGADGAVGTPLTQREGRYLGQIIPPLGVGVGKAARLRDYATARGIVLTASFVYTDAFTDAPVLEMVGYPVAVYPDVRLAALAAERGWSVIGTVTKER